ncbi:MAG: hypothetical protein M1541_09920 [Acidobacteria bacterium]|nr:hypothetical protein [Acidobacteriota bacterium]
MLAVFVLFLEVRVAVWWLCVLDFFAVLVVFLAGTFFDDVLDDGFFAADVLADDFRAVLEETGFLWVLDFFLVAAAATHVLANSKAVIRMAKPGD